MFASWIHRSRWWKEITPDEVEHFWANHGFALQRIASEWRFQSRDDLEAVVRIEFPDKLATQILHEHQGTMVDYHYCLYARHY